MMEALAKPLPAYLDKNYIAKALEKALNHPLIVEDCDIKLISANGENFCSDIYRVFVKYRNGSVPPEEAVMREQWLIVKDMIMEVADIGTNEPVMYEQVLPEMEKILRSALGMTVKLKANCLNTDCDNKELYILEDLNSTGYRVADRFVGLDAEHAMVLLKKIAQFHAASMLYREQFPAESDSLQPAHFSQGAADPLAIAIAQGGMQHVLKIIEDWDDFGEIAAKVRSNIGKFDEKIKKVVDPQCTQVKVFNHGDLWVNNFLFNYDGRRPKDVVFVDFQNCFVGSPGFDINYFLYSSVQLEVLKNRRYELLRCYYKSFKTTLKLCNVTHIPSWQMILEEVRNCSFLGYYVAVCELPLCCMDKEASVGFTTATFTDTKAMEQKRLLMYTNARVLDTLRYTLDYFNELTVLD